MTRHSKSAEQGSEGWRITVVIAQLLAAGANLARTLIEWSGCENWPPHL